MLRAAFATLVLAVLFLAAVPGEAKAQYCNFSVSDADFGTVDTLAGDAVTATATVDITCGGALALTSVDICLNINAGSGGSTGAIRHLRNAANDVLDFVLYQDPALTIPWGSTTSPSLGDPPIVELNLPALFGEISTSVTIYAVVPGNQETSATGVFSSLFSGGAASFRYVFNLILPLFDCSSGSTATPSFSTLAEVEENCTVEADDIAFGTQGVLTAAVDAEGEIRISCTPDTGFTIALDGGLAAAPPTAREMTFNGGIVYYGLYKDVARNEPWGDTGGDVVTGTGTGEDIPIPVYGRVPAQITSAPGTYRDTVVVTVTY